MFIVTDLVSLTPPNYDANNFKTASRKTLHFNCSYEWRIYSLHLIKLLLNCLKLHLCLQSDGSFCQLHKMFLTAYETLWGWDWRLETSLSPPVKYFFYWLFQGGASFVDHFCYSVFVFVMLCCLFIAALWSPIGKGLAPWLSCVCCFIVFWCFPAWCPGSDVVLDCIDSWSLLPYLHWK